MTAVKKRLIEIKRRSDELQKKVPAFAKMLPDVKEADFLLCELFAIAFDVADQLEEAYKEPDYADTSE